MQAEAAEECVTAAQAIDNGPATRCILSQLQQVNGHCCELPAASSLLTGHAAHILFGGSANQGLLLTVST